MKIELSIGKMHCASCANLLNRALKKVKHNQKEAARKLGITYHQFRGLYRKLQRHIK